MCNFPGGESPLCAWDTGNFDHLCSWSRTRVGGGAVAQSPILVTTITLRCLTKRGYCQFMLAYCLKISPQFNELLITWPVRSVVCEAHTAGDAGGAIYSIMGWFYIHLVKY
jgi:hypothetical protein